MKRKRYDPDRIEKEVHEFWKKNKIPEKIVKFDSSKPKFYLLDGPPYVNYVPHVGHVKTTTFKDVWGKFKHMQGYSVWFQPGFDCSGLPIENAVEKELGIKTKKEIEEKVGIEKFMNECKKWAEKNKSVWMDMYKELGAWRGWLDPYMTYKNYYLESGWWTIKKLFEKGMFVEGHKPGFWCPKCETVLAGYEVTDSYKSMQDPSIFIKFPVKGVKGEYLLVWTTTPWTLPANVAIVAHPDEQYVKIQVGEEKLILAEKRLEVLQELEMGYKVLDKFPGKELEGTKYEPVLNVPLQKELDKEENTHQVLLSIPIMLKRVASKTKAKKETEAEEEFGHMVDMETGSGLVHTAPGHGDVDNKLGKHYNLPEPSPVDNTGKLTEDAGEFSGMFVKKADKKIIEKLKSTGRLLHSTTITHSYPLCWRCKSPLIYRMSHQWFLKVDTIKKDMMKENEKVNWLPEFARERFDTILMDAPDWAITRQRYWGIPLPIWVCKKCGTKDVIGSREELAERATQKVPKDVDLHKDSVDKIKLKCKCGGEMERVPDIMDVWFDSGISPWASLGYPFKNKDLFETLWPIDLIDESQDQVRGWFYTLMFCGQATFDEKPYKTVCLNGWTLDGKGEKMSKSQGNVVWTSDALKELGADLLRMYCCWNVAPWDTQKFNKDVARDLGKSLKVLWHTYMFTKTYGKKVGEQKEFRPEDEWILSRISSLVESTTKHMEKFEFHYASRDLMDFVLNDFSRWYIKIIRDRVSPWYRGKGKKAAQYALNYVLEKLIKLLAPFAPYMSEKIYTDMFSGSSVHMSNWPKPEKDLQNKFLENEMEVAKNLIEAVGSARQEAGAKLRWPIKEIRIEPKDGKTKEALVDLKEIIMMLGNANDIKIAENIGKGQEFEYGKLEIGEVVEEEAFLREVVRAVQKLRKKSGLKVKDRIKLTLDTDKNSEKTLKKQEKELLKGVGAKSVSFGKTKGKGKMEFKKHRVKIGFDIL